MRRATEEHQVVYFVKSDFKYENSNELRRLEKQIEEDLLLDLRQNCYREKSYKETAIWRARTYGDERLIKRASDMETPSCDKINKIFNGG
jgi:DnaJ family protein B protein 12